jgi:DNA-directed RNA polymerase subunit RPC12/RpoP
MAYKPEFTVHKAKVASIVTEIRNLFLDKDEKSLAKELVQKYLQDYTIETISDQNTLGQLVYLEVLHLRLQRTLNKIEEDSTKEVLNSVTGQKEVSKSLFVPDKLIDSFHKNLREIVNLKEKLGITRNKTQETQKDAFSYLETVKKKYQVWLKENQASRYLTCPHCAKSIMLKIKTDAWEALKHPWFKDRILSNLRIVELYVQQKITKQDVAAIFDVSDDYAQWLTERWCKQGYLDKKEEVDSGIEINDENESGTNTENNNSL